MRTPFALACLALLLLAGCGQKAAKVDDARLVAADANAEWLSYGKSYSEQRFSLLDAINQGNAGQRIPDQHPPPQGDGAHQVHHQEQRTEGKRVTDTRLSGRSHPRRHMTSKNREQPAVCRHQQ